MHILNCKNTKILWPLHPEISRSFYFLSRPSVETQIYAFSFNFDSKTFFFHFLPPPTFYSFPLPSWCKTQDPSRIPLLYLTLFVSTTPLRMYSCVTGAGVGGEKKKNDMQLKKTGATATTTTMGGCVCVLAHAMIWRQKPTVCEKWRIGVRQHNSPGALSMIWSVWFLFNAFCWEKKMWRE